MSTITSVNPSALQIIKEKAFAILKQRYPEAWKETLEATVNESLVLLATDDYSGRVIDGGRGESLFSWSVEVVAPGSVLQSGDAYKIVDTPDGLDLVLIPTPMDDLIRRMASEPGGLDIKSHEDNVVSNSPMVTIHTVDELVAEAAQHLPGYDSGAHEDCEGIVVDRLTFQLIDEDTCLAILRKSADKESDLLFRFTSHIVRPDAVVGSIFSLIYSNGKVSVNCILQPIQDSPSALSEIKHHWIRKHVLGARLPAEFRAKINNAEHTTYINKTPISISHDDSDRIEFYSLDVLEGCVLTQIEGIVGKERADEASALMRTVSAVGSGDGTYELQVRIDASIISLGELDRLPNELSWPVFEYSETSTVPAVEVSCVQELKEMFDASFIVDDSETSPSSLMLVKVHSEDYSPQATAYINHSLPEEVFNEDNLEAVFTFKLDFIERVFSSQLYYTLKDLQKIESSVNGSFASDDNVHLSGSRVDETVNKFLSELNSKYPTDPMDIVTGKFKPKEILYHQSGFVIARGSWEGDTLDSVACRWHFAGELGYPNGFGKPQWMLLADVKPEHVKPLGNPLLKGAVQVTFRSPVDKLTVGQWVRTESDWHLVTYVYGDGTDTVSACGLGKRGSYPIAISDIVDVKECPSAMNLWFSQALPKKIGLWMDPMGRPMVTLLDLPDMLWGKTNTGNVYSKLTYSPSLASGKWICGDLEPACFDFMLDEHMLIGTIDIDAEGDNVYVNGKMEYDFTKIRKRLKEAVDKFDLDRLWDLYTYHRKDLAEYRHVFNEDLPKEQLDKTFSSDVNFGCVYYDLRNFK